MQNSLHTESKGSTLNESSILSGLRSGTYDGKIAGLYDLEDTLGKGHFAVVKSARHVFTGEKVAVKVIDKTKLDDISKAHLFQEIRCMKLVQHPNVVRLYEVIDTATKLYLVLELGDGGDLYEYILKYNSGLPEKIAKEYFRQIVKAISYCHQLHVVHRDLKPENVVFFKKQGVVKLTDFGFSNKFYPGQKLETSCGSLAYSAPEILLGDSYEAPAVDIWSLGVILYMLVCGQPPFQEANDSETLTMIMDCKYDIPSHVSENCKRLISRMLIRNPDKRATLAEITRHPWLTDGKENCPDMLPLVSKEHLSEEDQNLIVQKMVNGDIATKEQIIDCIEKNAYNHITATYYLLAERKLRFKRQEFTNKSKRPEQLTVSQNVDVSAKSCSAVKPLLLSVPRTPGDLPQRNRKCSIVQEADEEEISSCSRQESLGLPLNRRGSRSEGRLNLTLQEKIAEFERKKFTEKVVEEKPKYSNMIKISNVLPNTSENKITSEVDGMPYKPRKLLNNNQSYEQRNLKLHRGRTTSCSSSDASDDDGDKHKKQTKKLNTLSKSYQTRRDSHDDSSDSQEPGACSSASKDKAVTVYSIPCRQSSRKTESGKCDGRRSSNNSGNKHKIIKENENARLKESLSLNRISEVQEDTIISTFCVIPNKLTPKIKSVGIKILQNLKKNRNNFFFKSKIKKHKLQKFKFTNHILGKYFYVQKKKSPTLFCKNHFYETQVFFFLPEVIFHSQILYFAKSSDGINQNQNNILGKFYYPIRYNLNGRSINEMQLCSTGHKIKYNF